MKKAMIILFSGSLIFSATNNVIGQQEAYAANVKPVVFNFSNADESATELSAREVNNNAMTHFTKKNKNASAVTWTTANSVLSVYFTKGNVKSRSTYNANGQWQYTLRYMDAQQAPGKIVELIRSNYSKKIVLITEIQKRGYTYHLVKMEDDQSFLTVQVLNGEIDFFEQINK
jgi:hypothetical protein